MRWSLMLAAALAVSLSHLPTALGVATCVAPPTTLTNCQKYVTYDIIDTLNTTAADADAVATAVPLPNCMYFGLLEYQCQKNFPRCVPGVDASTSATELLLCKSVCEAGRTWSFQGATCSATLFNMDAECGNTAAFYDGAPPDCTKVVISEISNSTPAAWKWALVGIACAIGVAILVYMIVKCCQRSRVSPELTDDDIERPFEHETAYKKKMEKRAQGEAKQREEEARRRRMEAKRNDIKNYKEAHSLENSENKTTTAGNGTDTNEDGTASARASSRRRPRSSGHSQNRAHNHGHGHGHEDNHGDSGHGGSGHGQGQEEHEDGAGAGAGTSVEMTVPNPPV